MVYHAKTQKVAEDIGAAAGRVGERYLDRLHPKINAKVSEGRFELYSRRVLSRTTTLDRNLNYAIRILEESNLPNTPEFSGLQGKIAELKKLGEIIATDGKGETAAGIRDSLKKDGKTYADKLRHMGTGAGDPSGMTLAAVKENLDEVSQTNASAIKKLLEHAAEYGRAERRQKTKLITVSNPSGLAKQVADDIRKINMDDLTNEIKTLLYSKELLKMNRLAGLRMSLAVGNQVGEAADIAGNYWKRYIGEFSPAESQKTVYKILDDEAKKMEDLIKKTEEHLQFNRRIDEQTRNRINAENIRLFSIYGISKNGLSEEELADLEGRTDSINRRIGGIVATAKSSGQSLDVSKAVLKSNRLPLLDHAYSGSKTHEDFMLMLANAINQKDIYKYFELLDKNHIHIGEFVLKLIELKKAEAWSGLDELSRERIKRARPQQDQKEAPEPMDPRIITG